MKATGIVRRIDDLGRVVIPKEIRRTLRIREGDPLEIFVDRDGEVILKKYSPIGELGEFAQEYAESLYDSLKTLTLISDRDSIIAVSGGSKKDYADKAVGSVVETAMETRRTQVENTPGEYDICRDFREPIQSYVVAPIVSAGDPIGAVILMQTGAEPRPDGNHRMGDLEVKMAETAAAFLGKQMEQ